MDTERLADDVANGHSRIEGRVRILEDDLNVPPDGSHCLALESGDVATVEDDPSVGGLDQLDDRPAERRLAAPGLADDAERLAASNGEVDTGDRLHLPDRVLEDPGLDREVLDEALDAEKLVSAAGLPLRALLGSERQGLAHCDGSSTRAPTTCFAASSSAK